MKTFFLITYKILAEALMLLVILACGYLVSELVLPGFLSERVSLFSVVTVVVTVALMWLLMSVKLRYEAPASIRLPRTWIMIFVGLMTLVIVAPFENMSLLVKFFTYVGVALTIALVWYVVLGRIDEEMSYEEE